MHSLQYGIHAEPELLTADFCIPAVRTYGSADFGIAFGSKLIQIQAGQISADIVAVDVVAITAIFVFAIAELYIKVVVTHQLAVFIFVNASIDISFYEQIMAVAFRIRISVDRCAQEFKRILAELPVVLNSRCCSLHEPIRIQNFNFRILKIILQSVAGVEHACQPRPVVVKRDTVEEFVDNCIGKSFYAVGIDISVDNRFTILFVISERCGIYSETVYKLVVRISVISGPAGGRITVGIRAFLITDDNSDPAANLLILSCFFKRREFLDQKIDRLRLQDIDNEIRKEFQVIRS